jgi:hypothetical protein
LGNWKKKLEEFMLDKEFREKFSKKISNGLKKLYEGSIHPWIGRTHNTSSKKKMSEAKKGKYNGNKNPSFGTIWINNGSQSMKIKKTEQIPQGYKKGRLTKMLS